MRSCRVRTLAVVVALAACGSACAETEDRSAASSPTMAPSPQPSSASPSPSPSAKPPSRAPRSRPPSPGTVPPEWLGTRVLPENANGFAGARRTPRVLRQRRFTLPDRLRPLPGRGFAARIDPVPRRVLARSTWRPSCPVPATDLRWVRLTFRGFGGGRHTGELLVNAAVADEMVGVFRRLWRARYPIEAMVITTRRDLSAPPTGDGNGTGSFACRPVTDGSGYSQHAYGLAVDVNPFQNPYQKGELVLPELSSSYLDRGWVRPGMITPDGPVVRAFAAIGWGWGGDWRTLKDYQHFSANGR